MKTRSVLRDFPADEAAAVVRGADLVDEIRRLRLGELMVLLGSIEAGPVNELMSAEALELAAVDAFEALGLEVVRERVRAVHLRVEDFEDSGHYLAASMLVFGGPELFYKLMSMARRIHLAAGLLPL